MYGNFENRWQYVVVPMERYAELLGDSIKLGIVRRFLKGDSCVTFKELTEMIIDEKERPEC